MTETHKMGHLGVQSTTDAPVFLMKYVGDIENILLGFSEGLQEMTTDGTSMGSTICKNSLASSITGLFGLL